VKLDELTEETVRQVARSSIYTWNFTNSTAEDMLDLAQTDTSGAPPTPEAVKGSRPPGQHPPPSVVRPRSPAAAPSGTAGVSGGSRPRQPRPDTATNSVGVRL
jgi:hypothetical protein